MSFGRRLRLIFLAAPGGALNDPEPLPPPTCRTRTYVRIFVPSGSVSVRYRPPAQRRGEGRGWFRLIASPRFWGKGYLPGRGTRLSGAAQIQRLSG